MGFNRVLTFHVCNNDIWYLFCLFFYTRICQLNNVRKERKSLRWSVEQSYINVFKKTKKKANKPSIIYILVNWSDFVRNKQDKLNRVWGCCIDDTSQWLLGVKEGLKQNSCADSYGYKWVNKSMSYRLMCHFSCPKKASSIIVSLLCSVKYTTWTSLCVVPILWCSFIML